jgi:hypothetical protein
LNHIYRMNKAILGQIALGLLWPVLLPAQTLYTLGGTVGNISGSNVGVGTNAPAAKLHVVSGTDLVALFDNGGSPNAYLNLRAGSAYDAVGEISFQRNGPNNGHWYYGGNAAGYHIWRSNGYTIRMLLDHLGNLGIGTTTPSARLEVAGGSGASGVQSYFSVQAGYSAPSAGNIAFAGGTKLVLWNDVTTPQKLSIGMDANADMWFNNAGGQADAGFTFYTGNGGSVAPAAQLKITKAGNVGIGSVNPIDRLQITNAGDVRVVLMPNGGANNRESLIDYWSTFDNYVADTAPRRVARVQAGFSGAQWGTEYMAFGVGGAGDAATPPTERMRIDGAGNVGIGTSNPTQKLSVNGTVRAKEVIVDTGWSDFVFDESYQRSALSEVEQQIKAEKHLPGIPSANEVAEHGISVGEMQAKLLAKIEELTLHVIAQQKLLAEQSRKLSAQSARLERLEADNSRLARLH